MTGAALLNIIPRPPENALPWEKLSVALVDILGGMQQIVTMDELKRADAALGDSYRGLSSYERLAQTAVNVLVAKGVVDEGDLRVRMARLAVTLAGDKDRAHPKARFSNAGVGIAMVCPPRTRYLAPNCANVGLILSAHSLKNADITVNNETTIK